MGKTIPPLFALAAALTLVPAAAPGFCPDSAPPAVRADQTRSAEAAPPAEALTLRQCIDESLARNPLWLSSEQTYQASLARVRTARAIPQPSFDLDSDLQPRAFDFRGSGEAYVGLSQTVEFPGKRSLRGRIAQAESREVLADRDLLRLDLVFQVSEAFYGVLLAQENLAYAEEDLTLARDFQSQADLKYELGDVARVEALRAGVEAVKAVTAVRAAENDVRLAKAQLNYLLGRPQTDSLALRGGLSRPALRLDMDVLVARALTVRPEVRRVGVSLERETLLGREAWYGYLPDFDLGLARHRIAGEVTTWDFTLSFPIPLFFWQPASGPVAEAAANRRALSKEAEHWRNVIALEVEQAVLNAGTARSQIDLFETDILAQAEEVFELFQFSFREGEIGGLELIEARRTLLEARKSYADALFNYNVTLAILERAVGAPIDDAGGPPRGSGSTEGDGHENS